MALLHGFCPCRLVLTDVDKKWNLTVRGIHVDSLQKWNPTVRVPLCLAYFAEHSISEFHLYCILGVCSILLLSSNHV